MEYPAIILPDPTDEIYINDSIADELYSLWCGIGNKRPMRFSRSDNEYFQNIYIPVVPDDLLRSRTIPLPNFALQHNGRYFMTESDGTPTKFIVNTLFPEDGGDDFEVFIRCEWYTFHYVLKDEKCSILGSQPVLYESEFIPNLNSRRGISFVGWWYENPNTRKLLEVMRASLLADWYAIQLALLHPKVKHIFNNYKTEKKHERKGKGKDRRRLVRYVKKHIINEGEVTRLNSTDKGCLHRKTLAWWVIGHWRQYKDGHRTFIQGYWKGPLRECKRNLDNTRIREIVHEAN